jgi:hypothetical protein
MSDTPETDSLALGNHVVPTEFAQDLERQLRKARDWVFRLRKQRAIARNFGEQMERERDHWKSESLEQAKLLAMGADREEKLRTALQRLADCDWVISLPNRMDAVRKIAREALQ